MISFLCKCFWCLTALFYAKIGPANSCFHCLSTCWTRMWLTRLSTDSWTNGYLNYLVIESVPRLWWEGHEGILSALQKQKQTCLILSKKSAWTKEAIIPSHGFCTTRNCWGGCTEWDNDLEEESAAVRSISSESNRVRMAFWSDVNAVEAKKTDGASMFALHSE